MAIRRRKRVVRRHRRRGRRLYGGLMTEGQPQGNYDHTENVDYANYLKATGTQEYAPSKKEIYDWGRFLDRWVNSNRMSKEEMEPIMAKFRSSDPVEKQQAIEDMRTKLIVRDIKKSPEEYIAEWERGHHQKWNHMKALGRTVEAGTALSLLFLLGKTGALGAVGSKIKGLFSGTPAGTGNELIDPTNTTKTNPSTGIKEVVNAGKNSLNWLSGTQELAENAVKLTSDATAVKELSINRPFTIDTSMIQDGFADTVKNLYKNFDLTKITPQKCSAVQELFDTGAIVKTKIGQAIFVPTEDLPNYILKNPEGFEAVTSGKSGLIALIQPFLKPAWKRWLGWGFRISRKGRRLLRRYRRHLRHRRRY